MKVFEVVTEHCANDSEEIIRTVEYVTSNKNSLLSVTKYFTKHCDEYEKELKSVKDVLTITEQIIAKGIK